MVTRIRLWGIGALVVGVGMWAATFAIVLVGMRTAATWQAPGSTSAYLTPGKWLIVEKVPLDNQQSTSAGDAIGRRTVNVDQVSVVGQAGTVPVSCVYCQGSELLLPLDMTIYSGIGSFKVTQAGSYQLSATGKPAQLGVADPVQSVQAAASWWITTFFAGVLSVGLGIGLMVRAAGPNNTNNAVRVTPVASRAPSGWYPDPHGPDFERWWDGKTWTDHRR